MMHLLRSQGAVSRLIKKAADSGLKKSSLLRRYLNEEARDRVRALKPGDKLHGYTVNRVEEVPELCLTAAALTHDATGAQHLHAARDDSNNCFSVTFRTTPRDSTGVPHILEHVALCGSQKFPVRDPFFKMLTRSMATFMNALTAYDWTMYPFSSQLAQDFRNLMQVYMDAAFFPLIREMDFLQEGWRLEHAVTSDSSTPIIFKGVVYNEMKGVFSNPASVYSQAVLNALLPSHTYGVVSGGDPAVIPQLTHQDLQDFHTTHYHPSNARFFTYGDLPLSDHLEYISGQLEGFTRIPVTTQVPLEPRWTEPRTLKLACVPDPMAANPDKQTTVALSFLLNDVTDAYDSLVCSIVGHLLVEGETAPFYRALLEPQIGSDYAPTTGYHTSTREATFSVGLQNVHENDVDQVLKIIDETIDKVVQEGFDKKRIDALLHQIELGQKRETSNFGFNLSIGLASVWTHEADPLEHLQTSSLIARFKKELKEDPDMLKKKVEALLKSNPHRLTAVMTPDPGEGERRAAAEAARLQALVDGLTSADRQALLDRGIELEKQQSEAEDVSVLPCLSLADLEKTIRPEPIEMAQADWSFIQQCEAPTNGVSYLRMASNLEGLPDDLMPYVPLFCDVITSIGAEGRDYRWMSQQQELYTGGLSAAPLVAPHHSNLDRIQRAVLFSGHCLEKNFSRMLDLWKMILNGPDWNDHDRLSTLIKMSAAGLAQSLSGSGHSYAVKASAASLDRGAQLTETMTGYSQVRLMKQVAEAESLEEVVHNMRAIGHLCLDKTSIRLSCNATPESMDGHLQDLREFLSQIKGEVDMAPIFPELDPVTPEPRQTHLVMPFEVNYVGQSFPAVCYTHPDSAPLKVLGTLMSRKYLHREIREKGGAYGSGAQLNDGTFSFFSYRDPHVVETLAAFESCVTWATNGDWAAGDVDEAKLATFQQLDKPVIPGNRGQVRFLRDVSDEQRQAQRNRLMAVTGSDMQRVAQRYLSGSAPSGRAVLGPEHPGLGEGWTRVRADDGGDSSGSDSS